MNVGCAPAVESVEEPPRILVVEDEILIRDMIATLLREMGANVAEAANADEAWRYIIAGFQVDLVFTDHRMPGSMTGLQLAAKIRSELPHIEVVIASGDWQSLERTEPILAKPYPLEQTAADLTRRALMARRKD